jgi:hypothetical protein
MGTEVSLALQRRILARRDVYFLDEYTPSSWDILKCFGSTTINLVGADKFIRHVCSIFFKLSTDLVRSSARLALHAWWGGTHREIWGYVELIQKGFNTMPSERDLHVRMCTKFSIRIHVCIQLY